MGCSIKEAMHPSGEGQISGLGLGFIEARSAASPMTGVKEIILRIFWYYDAYDAQHEIELWVDRGQCIHAL